MSALFFQLQDVFINVVGGLQLREPAADVAIAVAICSRFVPDNFDNLYMIVVLAVMNTTSYDFI